MTDNVIALAEHLPEVDADLIESLRTMLSEAQAGRLVAMAAVYITDEGDVQNVYHIDNVLNLVAITALLHKDAIDLLSE
jgi:hypothetical protein